MPMTINEDPIRDVPETARLVGNVSPWTVYKWISTGKLKKTKVGGRTMIRESDLQAFLADCAANPAKIGRQKQEKAARIEETR